MKEHSTCCNFPPCSLTPKAVITSGFLFCILSSFYALSIECSSGFEITVLIVIMTVAVLFDSQIHYYVSIH
jgi:hypothetical protein